MKNIARTFVLAAALVGWIGATAAAQSADPAARSNTADFNFGIFMSGSAVEVESQGADGFGPGMGFQIGYGFTQNVSVFARGSAGRANVAGASSGVVHLDLGLRYSFGGTSWALRPFTLGALNGRIATAEDIGIGGAYARGLGLTGGAGLEYFVSPTVAIEAGFLYSFGVSNQLRHRDEWRRTLLDATSKRIEIGLSLHQ